MPCVLYQSEYQVRHSVLHCCCSCFWRVQQLAQNMPAAHVLVVLLAPLQPEPLALLFNPLRLLWSCHEW